MSQITKKWIADGAVVSGSLAAHGKIGSGAAASTSALFADGSGGTSFRALVAGDIPTISGSQVSGGTFGAVNGSALTNLAAANISGVLPVGVTGGSGLSIAYSQLTGTVPTWNQSTTGNADTATTATNIAGGSAGSLPYQSAASTTAMLGIGSTGQVLTVVAGVPAWSAPAVSPGAITLTTNHILVGNASNLAADVAMSGEASIVASGAITLSNAAVIAKVLTGYTSGAGTITSADSILSAIEKLNGNAANYLPLAGGTMSGNIAMGGNKVTGLGAPTANGDALRFDQLGAASGIATLDGSGKIPLSQLPSSLMEFKGSWNPNTNTPALVDGTGTTGFTYWVSAADLSPVAGLADASMYNFQIGDLVIYNGSAWVLVTPAAGVQSVNGAQGAVVMSMASANGFAGTYSGTALTVSTTVTGLLKGNGTAISAATAGTDYVIPSGSITGTASNITASSNSTLTTLSALSLPTSQLSGNISLTTQVSGILPIANGGTNANTAAAAFNNLNPMTTTGDTIYESSTGVAARLPVGSTGQVLTVVAGVPAWSNTAATMTNAKETFVLSGTDITNQFVTLAHTPLANSTDLLVQGAGDQLEGASYDYTVSGATIVFQNGLATGGVSALVAGDVLQVQYEY